MRIARATVAALLAGVLGCAGAPPRPPQPQRKATRPAAAAPARSETAPRPAPPPAAAKTETPAPAPEGASPATAPLLPPRAQRLFEEAVRAEEEQRKLPAPDWGYLERKWRAVADAADVAEAHHNIGVALEAQGKLDDARAAYERARELKPGLRQASVNLAVLLEKRGDTRGAAAAYAECIRDFPEDAVARARLAALYAGTGQLDEAWRLARVALRRDQHDLAKLVALRAQKLDERDPELPFTVGQALARGGDEAGAQVQFRKALSLSAGFLPARYALLEGALRKKAWQAVAEHADAIVKAEPDNAPVHLALGLALRYTGKPDEALAAYDRAEKASGDRLAEVHLARGVLLARVKSECTPALAELREYQGRAGPVAQDGAQVVKLQRECEAQIEENRKAVEAAKQMQAESERKGAEKGGGAPPSAGPASPEGRAPSPPAPHPAR
jgi:tetratricopeptide (TPR) repeat protein